MLLPLQSVQILDINAAVYATTLQFSHLPLWSHHNKATCRLAWKTETVTKTSISSISQMWRLTLPPTCTLQSETALQTQSKALEALATALLTYSLWRIRILWMWASRIQTTINSATIPENPLAPSDTRKLPQCLLGWPAWKSSWMTHLQMDNGSTWLKRPVRESCSIWELTLCWRRKIAYNIY